MRDKIIIVDNTISQSDCDYLIKLFEDNPQHHQPWLDYNSMTIKPPGNKRVQDILLKVIRESPYVIEWCEVAKRPPTSGHPKHFDLTSHKTIFTSVTYLNHDFTGGETYIVDDIEISPKMGRTLYFDGQCYEHGVNTVKDSDRYTLAIWYTTHDTDSSNLQQR